MHPSASINPSCCPSFHKPLIQPSSHQAMHTLAALHPGLSQVSGRQPFSVLLTGLTPLCSYGFAFYQEAGAGSPREHSDDGPSWYLQKSLTGQRDCGEKGMADAWVAMRGLVPRMPAGLLPFFTFSPFRILPGTCYPSMEHPTLSVTAAT